MAGLAATGIGAYRIGDRAQAGTPARVIGLRCASISNRRPRSSRNTRRAAPQRRLEHIESETALKPEHLVGHLHQSVRAYRIGDRAQAGTFGRPSPPERSSISNRRPRSSRNRPSRAAASTAEHIESETALKPELTAGRYSILARAYRIGDRAQAGTGSASLRSEDRSISNRRPRSSRNA